MIKRLFSSTPITITNCAWDKMTEILIQKNMPCFLFSAMSGGCNGFNYNLKLLDDNKYLQMYAKSHKIPLTILEKNAGKVVIDPMSEMYLLGTTIDYVKEDYDKGLFENRFTFTADKEVASSCGCGISFTPKD